MQSLDMQRPLSLLRQHLLRGRRVAALVMGLLALLMVQVQAAEKLRVGKAVAEAFSFTPIEIGIRTGIFAKHGLDVESIAFTGDARMQQAAAAGSIDILVGSGPPWPSSPRVRRSRQSPRWPARRC